MNSLYTYQDHRLQFHGHTFDMYMQNYQKPLYIYDLALLAERARQWKTAFIGSENFYALKANHFPAVVTTLVKHGFGVDAVSGAEIAWALKLGVEPSRIIFSGVGKTSEELQLALNSGIFQINVESPSEYRRILHLQSKNAKSPVSIALRVNPDVDPKTHPYISTGLRENKFGLSSEEILEIIDIQSPAAPIVGLSCHIGSQMLELDVLQESMTKLREIFRGLRSRVSSLQRVDIGGGVGIDYHNQDLKVENHFVETYGALARQIFAEEISKGLLLMTEPGRFLVGHCGVLLCQIQYIKQRQGKAFVVVDSGMTHLMRPALYEAHHRILPVVRRDRSQVVDVVGPVCESSDVLARDRELTLLAEGDFLVIADVGAYGSVMQSDYNLFAKAGEELF